MQSLQRLLLCLLCAALPWRGIAGVLDVPAPCSMTQSQAMAPATDAAIADACCEHGDPAGSGGDSCKSGQDCLCGGFGVLVPSGATTQRPQASLQPLPARLPVATFHPSAVWRPPTLI